MVESGYLYPFGHRASLVTVSERKLKYAPDAASGLLMQREYLVVRQQEVDYTTLAGSMPNAGRDLPFTSVRLTAVGTPNIDQLGSPSSGSPPDQWIRVGGKPFLFHAVARDKAGQEVDFLTALAFLPLNPDSTTYLNTAKGQDSADGSYHADGAVQLALSGQSVAYAESAKHGDTTLETQTMRIGAEGGGTGAPTDPPFYPSLSDADISVPAIKRLTGNTSTVNIAYFEGYRTAGFAGSQPTSDVFARLTTPFTFSFGPADKSGGISTLSQTINGISRSYGPIGFLPDGSPHVGSSEPAYDSFDPARLFPADAKLLGGILLKDVIEGAAGVANVPMLTTTVDPATATTTTTFTLKPQLKKLLPFVPSTTAALAITMTVVASPDGASYTITGTLTNFGIQLGDESTAGVLINFTSMKFIIDNGSKPKFTVGVGAIQFQGALRFVNALETFLGRFDDPPYLDVQPGGIEAGFTLAIPTLPLGPVILSNLALSAGVVIPFTGEPVLLNAAVSERDHPFIITYGPLGGGGFFALSLGAHGIARMEAALEFGGSFSLNLGVASGGVYVLVGIYYARVAATDATPETIALSAFFRAGGSMGVLGIATVSIEFYLSLTYTTGSNPAVLAGDATLTVEVSVAFFHKSIDLSIHRELNDPPPTFEQLLSLDDWTAYNLAFA